MIWASPSLDAPSASSTVTTFEYTWTAFTPDCSNSRRASTSHGRWPTASAADRYRSCPIPVRLRFRSNTAVPGLVPRRSVTLIN